ncbi:MAG: methylated-DNA--[protein]-cysteine S-methyltransferase [Chloroflexota bacterium]
MTGSTGSTGSTAPAVPDDIEAALAALATSAPGGLAVATLAALGLADLYATMPSPLGDVLVTWNGRGVSAVSLAENEEPAALEARHFAATGRRATRATGGLPAVLARAIARRMSGDRRVRIALDLRGRGDFERQVWLKALEIPSGEVRPYGWIAAEIGRPRAVRAVGSALGHNPVPLIVPCHRVVRGDGTIGQYSLGGPANKRAILAAEGVDPDALEAMARAGVRLIGSDSTRIVCHPTCRNARRIRADHRVPFRSITAASDAGYRPCRVCRPASSLVGTGAAA